MGTESAARYSRGLRSLQVLLLMVAIPFAASSSINLAINETTATRVLLTHSRALVISRSAKDGSRLAAFQSHARAANLQVELWEAVDKDVLRNHSDFTDDLIRRGLITNQSVQRPGTLACALSHFMLWQQLAAQTSSNMPWLIFEDDSQVPPQFLPMLSRIVPMLPPGWHFAMLNHNRLHGSVVNRAWMRPKTGFRRGTNGFANAYLVTPAGARAALQVLLPFSAVPIQSGDNAIKKYWGRQVSAFFVRCCLVPQSGSPSVREAERRLQALALGWRASCVGARAGNGCTDV